MSKRKAGDGVFGGESKQEAAGPSKRLSAAGVSLGTKSGPQPLPQNVLWKIVFPTPNTFKNMIKIVAGVLCEANIQLIKSDEFEGLLIESLHSSHVCLIIASYAQNIQCDESLMVEQQKFKLKTDILKRLLDELDSNSVLEMYREVNSDDIILRQVNDYGLRSQKYTIHTLAEVDKSHNIKDIESAIGVDLCVLTMKSFCKTSKDLGANHVQILVKKWEHNEMEHMCLTLDSDSTSASMMYEFYCVIKRDTVEVTGNVSESYCIRAVTDGSTGSFEGKEFAEVVFDHKFSCEYLNCVLRNMERDTIHMSLSQNSPLIIKYSLGDDQSDIKVVVSPMIIGDTD
jgi:hypothetical protein